MIMERKKDTYYDRHRAQRLAYAAVYREANVERLRTYRKGYNNARRVAISRYNKVYNQRNQEKIKCHRIMWKAIRAGELVIGPCTHKGLGECSVRIQGHHDDHSKPLEVTWFCTSHHQQYHRGDLVLVKGCMTSKKLQELLGA